MKSISLFQALQGKTVKKAKEIPVPIVDTSYLKKFSNVSEELKKEIVKTASGLSYSKDQIFTMVSDLDKNHTIQKQADYIRWYKQITSS